MSDKPDWDAICKEYAAGGISFEELAFKCRVAKTTLQRKFQKWTGPDRTAKNGPDRTEEEPRSLHIVRNELPSIPSAVDGANFGIEALVEILKENKTRDKKMDLSEHVKAATALYQYNRIIVNAAPVDEKEEEDTELITIDTRDLDADRLAKLKAFALDMKESEQVG